MCVFIKIVFIYTNECKFAIYFKMKSVFGKSYLFLKGLVKARLFQKWDIYKIKQHRVKNVVSSYKHKVCVYTIFAENYYNQLI